MDKPTREELDDFENRLAAYEKRLDEYIESTRFCKSCSNGLRTHNAKEEE